MTKDHTYNSRHARALGAPNIRTAGGEYNFVFSSDVRDWYRSKAHTHKDNYQATLAKQRKKTDLSAEA